MTDFNIVVPNLDRRPDRWYSCYGALLALGFPVKRLHRFSAHDHVNYDSREQAKAAATKQFPNSEYLRNVSLEKGYYCWSWTWYDIMTQIADGSDDSVYTLFLIDDYTMMVTYSEVLEHIRLLSSCGVPLKMIQYAFNDQRPGFEPQDSLEPGEPVERTALHRGLSHSGDAANLLTPLGAKEILNLADNIGGACGVPNWVFWWAARKLPPDGYFSTGRLMARAMNRTRHISWYEDAREGMPPNNK
ncbi:MAG: hypothetical protein OXN17_08260 [Candidatus Poribacteria bacterium]|nr:hypothetical protein [Candidatus Poribacteria bacterium]MDE0505614.1 hypothetical protein [Candidatus Poribacteria bacterium]